MDWTTGVAQSGVDVTRAGVATFVGSNGLIQSATANTQRLDWSTGTSGLLVEESRANALFPSEDINTGWTLTNATIDPTAITAPDGTTSAYKFIENVVTGNHRLNAPVQAWVTGTVYTISFFVNAAGRTLFSLFDASVTGAYVAQFNLVAKSAAITFSTGSNSCTIKEFSDGWFRCTYTQTSAVTNAATAYLFRLNLQNSSGQLSYEGDGVSGMYVWGGQKETGAFATSYIPTVAAAVTRNADVATMTGTNFSDWFNATEGGAVVQVLPSTISGTRPAVQFDDNTANEFISLRGVAADPQLFVVDGGVTQATLDAGTIAANILYKLGGAWKDASYAVALNGAAPVTQASGTFPTATQARLGSDGTNYLNGHLQSLRFWPQRLTNAEVQAFSK